MILDLRLGDLESGWTTLEQLRLDPRTARVPVIVCSADVRFLREKAETLRRHRCDVLEKPFELDDLLAKVRAFIGPPSPAEGRPAP